MGIFDSRCVAVADLRSDGFKQLLGQEHAQLKTAKQAGDQKTVPALEAWGPAM